MGRCHTCVVTSLGHQSSSVNSPSPSLCLCVALCLVTSSLLFAQAAHSEGPALPWSVSSVSNEAPISGFLNSANLAGAIVPFKLKSGEKGSACWPLRTGDQPATAHLLALCLEPKANCQLGAAIASAADNAKPISRTKLYPRSWTLIPVTVPTATATPAPDRALRLSFESDIDATVLVAVPDVPSPQAVDAQLPYLGNVLQGARLYEAALITWQQYAERLKGAPTVARALLGQGDALKGLGRLDEAFEIYQSALLAVDPTTTRPGPADLGNYSANRLSSDLGLLIRSRCAALVPKDRLTEKDGVTLRGLAAVWPPTPESKRVSLQLAQHQIRNKQVSAQTISFLLSIFDESGEHCNPFVTKLSDNQALIDRISHPTEEALLTEALTLLCQLGHEWRLGYALPPKGIKAAAQAWQQAELAGLTGDGLDASEAFAALLRQYKGTLIAPLARLAAGQWAQSAGAYRAAAQFYSDGCRAGGPTATRCLLGMAELTLAQGNKPAALRGLTAIAEDDSDERVRHWARYRIAQCYEFTADWPRAIAQYAEVATSSCIELAEEARMAGMRLDRLSKCARSEAPNVRYVGEDRSTQGDWYTYYGSKAFILCAQQAPQDVAGGRLENWAVRPTCGNSAEKVRYWISGPSDSHPSMLYNPLARTRRAANWDDRGETYPRGTGPDLWLEVPVPAGEHRISLYFVNDHNYYEPRRAYTISVFDETGRYQAGADVRGFVNGVYEQFGATGPCKLRMLISRNLSMNVLLSGVFLDPLKDGVGRLAPASAPWRVWQTEHERHLSSADERNAFMVAARTTSPASNGLLSQFIASSLSARQYGLAVWATEAKTKAIGLSPKALMWHLQDTITSFSATSEIRVPSPFSATIPWPFVEASFRQYLENGSRGLKGERLADFYRKSARAHEKKTPHLAALAYERLLAAVGEAGLAAEDHYRMTFVALDKEADTRRLERAVVKSFSNRDALQMQLLGRYLAAGKLDHAQALVDRMRADDPSSDATANAVLNLGSYYLGARRLEGARACFEEVMGNFADSPWAALAQQKLGAAAPQ